jgi:hypothetical protein
MSKKSFVLFNDYRETFEELTDEDAGSLIKAIFAYSDGENVELKGVLKIAFIPIKQQLDRNMEKWKDEIEKRREAGRLGGLKKAANLASASKPSKCYNALANPSKAKQNLANLADNVTVTVNVNDINKKTNIYSEDFESIWTLYPKQGRTEKKKVYEIFKRTVKTDQDLNNIELAVKNYSQCKTVRDGFIQGASRWFKSWEDWIEHEETEPANKNKVFIGEIL